MEKIYLDDAKRVGSTKQSGSTTKAGEILSEKKTTTKQQAIKPTANSEDSQAELDLDDVSFKFPVSSKCNDLVKFPSAEKEIELYGYDRSKYKLTQEEKGLDFFSVVDGIKNTFSNIGNYFDIKR